MRGARERRGVRLVVRDNGIGKKYERRFLRIPSTTGLARNETSLRE